jgi:hypothetical protein
MSMSATARTQPASVAPLPPSGEMCKYRSKNSMRLSSLYLPKAFPLQSVRLALVLNNNLRGDQAVQTALIKHL